MKSIYQRLRERNLCNHRDFQNIGVNGARTTSMQPPGAQRAGVRVLVWLYLSYCVCYCFTANAKTA